MTYQRRKNKKHEICDKCECCGEKFSKMNCKVHHHCHITGNYLAAVCNNCNLQLKPRKRKTEDDDDGIVIPVIIHNLKGYDSHLILKSLTKMYASKIRVIPTTEEKFLSFEFGCLRFLDSLQFMNASLDSLVTTLKKSGYEKFAHTTLHLPHLDLVTRKGVYPYEYMSDRSKFNDRQLPTIDDFYSKLTDSNISNAEYKHAQLVWESFNMSTMQEYHDLYLKTDVLLLADVFEEFRRMALEHYKIDPAHCFTAPGLSFQACLKMTGVKLELLTDIDQLLFIEQGIRGGTSYIANRLATANNEFVGYDESKPPSHIMYLDANNLYGWAISQKPPIGQFQFLDVNNFDVFP